MMHRILAVAVNRHSTPLKIANLIGTGRLHEARPFVAGLAEGLQRLGYGPNSFEIDYLEDEPQRLQAAIRAAVKGSRPKIIFPIASSALKAARAVDKDIPIIFPNISDPMEEGVVKSCARPATNVSGVRPMRRHTAPDCLELFKASAPSLKHVFALHQPGYLPSRLAMKNLRLAAKRAGVGFHPVVVKQRQDIERRLQDLMRRKAALTKGGPGREPQVGLLMIPDDLVMSEAPHIIVAMHNRGIPTFAYVVELVRPGMESALGAYGVPQHVAGEAAAHYAHKILNGAKPAHLPVKRIGGFEWVVNEGVAKALKITIPPEVLKAVDRRV